MAIYQLKEGFTISPTKKVIKAEEYLLQLKAEELIAKEKEEAQKIIEEAKRIYEKEKKRGYEEGLKEGKMHMTEQMLNMVSKSVNYFASVEEKIIKIVMTALKKIIGEIDRDELVVRVVKNALAAARNQKQVVIRVAPEQVEVVKKRINEIIAEFPAVSFLEVTADSRLKPGGCIVESEIGIVDASIDVQLEAIYRSLTRSFKKSSV